MEYSPPSAFSLATFALDDSARLWPNARRDRNRFSSLPNNSRHRPAIRSTRSSINSLMRIALTHRYRRTPHADVVDNFRYIHDIFTMRCPWCDSRGIRYAGRGDRSALPNDHAHLAGPLQELDVVRNRNAA